MCWQKWGVSSLVVSAAILISDCCDFLFLRLLVVVYCLLSVYYSCFDRMVVVCYGDLDLDR